MINIEQYKLNSEITKDILKDNNFKYMDGYYSYRFPVYKYKKEPTLWCNLFINLENNCWGYNVVDSNFNTYPAFFNREYSGINVVVQKAENKIKAQFDKFVKDKILYKKNKKEKKEGVKS